MVSISMAVTTAAIASLRPNPNPNRLTSPPYYSPTKTMSFLLRRPQVPPSSLKLTSTSLIRSALVHRNSSLGVPSGINPREKLRLLAAEFANLSEPLDRVKRLLHYASCLPAFAEEDRVPGNRVMGCTAQVWLKADMDGEGNMRFAADSDSEITKGFCACLVEALDGAKPEEIVDIETDELKDLNVGSGISGSVNSRVNTWYNVLVSMQKKAKMLAANRDGRCPSDPFPSLIIDDQEIRPLGSYAEAQAMYLSPDEVKIKEVVQELKEKKIGVVAHFYMDPEVQGVLTAAQKEWPHIHISDSLVMADSAVKMAEAGCQHIAVLGVDFMSENVRSILDLAGFEQVSVYRMSDERIGCSLAEAASAPSYTSFLESASISPPSLHVIYINTSLETKALGHQLVPTITCTSSNVVQTILQAFAQIPGLKVWYGPDSYMGANIVELFQRMVHMSDEEIALVHPKHNRNSIDSLLPRLHYFQDGVCVVHDLFGHEVVEKIKEMYCDAFLAAHFEVPGEMFSLAMEAKKRGMGVVGSTKNILDFIKQHVEEALDRNVDDHLQFVLGTESGMITAIVAAVRQLLKSNSSSSSSSGKSRVSVEIVFPVSSQSISTTSSTDAKLSVVPGVSSGEGCSIHGGCASCPYMKMNSLSSLLNICRHLPDEDKQIASFEAKRFNSTTLGVGKSVAEVGCEPILHMRHFQATGELPEKLVSHIYSNSQKTQNSIV